MLEESAVPNGTHNTDSKEEQVSEQVNGNDAQSTVPTTPKPNHTQLALTEYSVNPSPPSSTPRGKASSILPQHLLLSNGHPDVSYPLGAHCSDSHPESRTEGCCLLAISGYQFHLELG